MRDPNFMAQDDYIVTKANYFSDFDQKVAISLYQPLVGPNALALYLSLWNEASPHPVITDRKRQTRLLDLLNINIDALYEARVRLEAVGLLKTYTAADQMSRYYVYELYAPVSPTAFLNDDLLGMLLYDKVGKERYAELSNQFTLHPVRRDSWQDISKTFLEVFSLHNVLETPPAVAQARQQVAQKPTPEVTLGDATGVVDWELLTQMLDGLGVKANQVDENRNEIGDIAKFYGLTVPKLANLIGKASDITGKINIRTLRTLAQQALTNSPHFSPKSAGGQKAQAQPAETVQQGRFSSAEQDLLRRAKAESIGQFMDETKKQLDPNLYVGASETKAVRDLAQTNALPDSVINILTDYLIKKYTTLTQGLVTKVSQDWVRSHVQTPEDALAALANYDETKQTTQKRRQSGNRHPRQEEVPSWLKKQQAGEKAQQPDEKQPQKPADPGMQSQIKAKREALRALQDKGGQQG